MAKGEAATVEVEEVTEVIPTNPDKMTKEEEIRANGGFPEGYDPTQDLGPERPEDSIDVNPEGFEPAPLSAEEN